MKIKLMNGNVLEMLRNIPDESVDCVVSSPPYYGLRDYSGVATYASEDYDELLRIANINLLILMISYRCFMVGITES